MPSAVTDLRPTESLAPAPPGSERAIMIIGGSPQDVVGFHWGVSEVGGQSAR